MTMASLGNRPPRALLRNLVTGQEYEFLFNPQTYEEKVQVKFNRISIIGHSSEILQYKNTSNNVTQLELYLSAILQDKMSDQGRSESTIAEQRAWLLSLAYPVSNEDLGHVGPPHVLLVWPGRPSRRGRITDISFIHREFSVSTLETIQLIARLTFEDDPERRILSEDVQLIGSRFEITEG